MARRVLWTRERLALAGGLLALCLAVVGVGARPADRVAGQNGVPIQSEVLALPGGQVACQDDAFPRSARGIRVPVSRPLEPTRARLIVLVAGRRLPGAWRAVGRSRVVLPVHGGFRPAGRVVEICIEAEGPGVIALAGAPTGEPDRLRVSGGTAPAAAAGRMRVDFLFSAERQSFWSRSATAIPRRIAGATGSRLAPVVVLLGGLTALLALAALVARRGSGARREVVLVLALAAGSGAAWAGLTPMFQSTDELAHAAYVQTFGERGHPPRQLQDTGDVSEEMACWATVTRLLPVRFYVAERPSWVRPPDDPCAAATRESESAQYHAVQPPAYYAAAASGYALARAAGRPLPDALLVARLVSVLLAALTTLAVFLLVRELLPASPWPARAAAVAVALQPVVMFNLSVVNSDALVACAAAWACLLLARAWRRGPSRRRALALGAVLGVGLVAKINFLVVVPVVVMLQLVVWLRGGRGEVRERALQLALASATTLLPGAVYVAVNRWVWDRGLRLQSNVSPPLDADPLAMASHVWQTFLPRLPFMEVLIPGRPPVIDSVFLGMTTRFGHWNDYGITGIWRPLLVSACAAIVVVAVVQAVRTRGWRFPLALAAVATVVYCVLVVVSLYGVSSVLGPQIQPRYLLPLAPVWGLAVGAALTLLRAPWQGVAVALFAVAMLGWSALGVAATLGRFYL